MAASAPPEALFALNERGVALCEVLHSDAIALAKRGLMNGKLFPDRRDLPRSLFEPPVTPNEGYGSGVSRKLWKRRLAEDGSTQSIGLKNVHQCPSEQK